MTEFDANDRSQLAEPTFLAQSRLTKTEKDSLALARESLTSEGFYAYAMLSERQLWCIAIDDERGRVDVSLDENGYLIDFRGVSPGLFQEEASEWRRKALQRLARRVVPNVSRGMLKANQIAEWSDQDEGVAVFITYHLPFDDVRDLGAFVRATLPEIDDLVTEVESQLRS